MSTTANHNDIFKHSVAPTETPFKNIALSFSGGGFRAASFSLGVLSYLNEVNFNKTEKLLNRVTYISSASGGTITNATYALSVAQMTPFSKFYKHLFEKLEGVSLIDTVFTLLNDNRVWKSEQYKHKRRNLINALAIAYEQSLFTSPGGRESAKLAALMIEDNDVHLEEVCFNTTDFYRGLLFRQAVKLKPDGESTKEFLYGNYILNVAKDAYQHFSLGDIVAASSCFPAGFEPIVFPSDFINDQVSLDEIRKWTLISPQELSWSELNKIYSEHHIEQALEALPKPLDIQKLQHELMGRGESGEIMTSFETGFMDGGITDNQGIDSMMRANQRREWSHKLKSINKSNKESGDEGLTKFLPFDLMMTNDVSSHYMQPFTPRKNKRHSNLIALKLNTVLILGFVSAAIGITLFFLANHLCCLWAEEGVMALGVILTLVGASVLAVIFYSRKFIRKKVRAGGLNLDKTFSPKITERFFHFFGGTPIGVLLDMLKDRTQSVLTLNSDVFLKRVRQLLYEKIVDEGRACHRLKTNHVYDLAYVNDINRLQNEMPGGGLQPSAKMQNVAQCAFEMGTTLWFNPQQEKFKDRSEAALIATGHFTTCYNLLEFILRMKSVSKDASDTTSPSFYDGLSKEWQETVDGLHDQLNEHYKKFREDPFWLYNQLGKQCGIDKFVEARFDDYKVPHDFSRLR